MGSTGNFEMCHTVARWIVLAACLTATSCGEKPAGQKAAAVSPHSASANLASTDDKFTEDNAAAPLSARIEFPRQFAEPTIEYDSPFQVVLTNLSGKPVRIWNPNSRNGHPQFAFHFTDPRSDTEKIARRRAIDDEDFWKQRSARRKPGWEFIEIAANGERSFDFVFSEFEWGERAWVGLPSPNAVEPYSVSVRFTNAETSPDPVWTGSIQSEPLAARFVAADLKTPHEYLWHGFGEKAIEVMEENPHWVNAPDEDRCTPLHHAARFGPIEAVQWLVDHGADVDAIAYNNFTALHLADDPAIVRLILEEEPDLTVCDVQGQTPAQRAAANMADAHIESVREHWRQLVVLYEDAAGGADLLTAAILGDLERVKAILAQSPELADDFEGKSPLRTAASRGHLDICRFLLANYRVDVNDFERGIGYPIIKEALAYPDVVRLLIEHRADLKTRITWQGFRSGIWIIGDDATALHYAADDGVPETINLLLDSGVDIFAEAREPFDDTPSQTALEVAAFFGKAANANVIVNHPKFDLAEPQKRQNLLDKALRIAASSSWLARDANRPELMEILIRKGANPNTSDDGSTPVLIAACDIHPESDEENAEIRRTIGVLVKHGAKVNIYSAVAIGDEKRVRELLESDRRLASARGPGGDPALHVAVSMNYKGIVSALLDAGCDVNIPNQSTSTGSIGDTALDWADFWERDEMAALLIQAGGRRSPAERGDSKSE